MTMTFKRLKQPVIGAAVLAALALGGSALAGSAAAAGGSSSTAAGDVPSAKATAAPLSSVGGGSLQAMNHVRDGWIHDLYLTDHQRYVRHHQRLGT
jgi:Spy/CpxP family protein refolding chaperone